MALGLGWTKALLLSVTVLVFFVQSIGGTQDRAGEAMAGGFAVAALLYLFVVVVPALVLAHRGRLIGVSLALLLVPGVLLLPAIFAL
ncbi:MAG TPA: hypothetical protein VGU24_16460 [Microvirga sp.]|nr:hypothetical protein [Microvirga sp.]